MKSVISSSKLLRQLFRRQIWVFALSCLGAFLCWPILGLNLISALWMQQHMMHTVEPRQAVAAALTETLSGGQMGGLIVLAAQGIAVLAAWSGFAALHARDKTDLLRSLPIRRQRIFRLRVIIAALDLAIPNLLGLLALLAVALSRGLPCAALAAAGIRIAAGTVAGGLLVYAAAALAMELTGQMLVGALGTAVFLGIGPLLAGMNHLFAQEFFATYQPVKLFTASWGWRYTSPVNAGIYASLSGGLPLAGIALAACAGLLLCRWVDAVRPAEAAGRAMAFRRPTECIAAVLSATGAVVGGYVFYTVRGYGSDAWLLFGLVLGLLVVFAVFRMITTMDFSRILSGRRTLLAAGMLAVAFTAVFRFDLTGFDARLPRMDQIADIAILPGAEQAMERTTRVPWQSRLEHMHLGCDEELYDLLGRMAHGHRKQDAEGDFYGILDRTPRVTVRVTLNDGRLYTRGYIMDFDEIAGDIANLYARKDYLDALYPVRGLGEGHVGSTDILLSTGLETTLEYPIDRAGIERLAQAIAADSGELTPETVQRTQPVSNVGMYMDLTEKGLACIVDPWENEDGSPETKVWYEGMIIWPTFRRTLAVLDSLGIRPDSLDRASIRQVFRKRRENDGRRDAEEEVTDAAEIDAILPKLILPQNVTRWTPLNPDERIRVDTLSRDGYLNSEYYWQLAD